MKFSFIADKAGMCVSVGCAIHCLLIPLLLFLSAESTLIILDNYWIEGSIILLVSLMGIAAIIPGLLIHRQHYIPILFISGLLLIVAGESVQSPFLGIALSISGTLIILYTHYFNLKLRSHASAGINHSD